MEAESSDAEDSALSDPEGSYNLLLLSLQRVYENASFDSRLTVESYSWLLNSSRKAGGLVAYSMQLFTIKNMMSSHLGTN